MLLCHGLDGIVRKVTAIGTREDFLDTRSWLMLLLAVYENVFIIFREEGAESLCYRVSGIPPWAGTPSLTYLCLEDCTVGAPPNVTFLANFFLPVAGTSTYPCRQRIFMSL